MPERNTVKIIDRGWDKLKSMMSSRKYSAGGGRAASVGIQGDIAEITTEEHGGMTNVELGAIHEFGTRDGRVPARSFFRATFDAERKKYQAELDKIAKAGFGGKEMEGELLLLGELHRTDIINKIRAGIGEPVEGRTPLIRTGQLLNSITAVVVNPKDVK